MNLFCKLGLHSMEIFKVEPYIDTSYGGNAHSTRVYKRCKRMCGKITSKGFYGNQFTLSDIVKESL